MNNFNETWQPVKVAIGNISSTNGKKDKENF